MRTDRTPLSQTAVAVHLAAALCVGLAVAGCYLFVDRQAALRAHGLDPGLVAVFKKITLLGSSTPYLVAVAVLYPVLQFLLRRTGPAQRVLFLFAAIAASGVTVDLIKPVLARWRPSALFEAPSHYGFSFFKVGYAYNSFPSGHATTAFAVACALSLLYPRLRLPLFAAAAVAAASRVIVGAHYPGDVIAGAWFGVVVTLALARTAWFRGTVESQRSA